MRIVLVTIQIAMLGLRLRLRSVPFDLPVIENGISTSVKPIEICRLKKNCISILLFRMSMVTSDAWRSEASNQHVDLRPRACTSAVNRGMPTSVPPGTMLDIDLILRAMLASGYGVPPPSLLSLRPASPWVSRDILRYS